MTQLQTRDERVQTTGQASASISKKLRPRPSASSNHIPPARISHRASQHVTLAYTHFRPLARLVRSAGARSARTRACIIRDHRWREPRLAPTVEPRAPLRRFALLVVCVPRLVRDEPDNVRRTRLVVFDSMSPYFRGSRRRAAERHFVHPRILQIAIGTGIPKTRSARSAGR